LKRTTLFLVLLSAAALAVLTGCGGRGGGSAAGEGEGASSGKVTIVSRARLVFETGGYIPMATGNLRHMVEGGLFAMGDIDGDGYTDLAVSSAKHPGYLCAYSGKNGEEIWRFAALTGSAAKAAGETGYSIESFVALEDFNGDTVPDIFLQDGWGHKKVFLISGKDGSLIVRSECDRVAPAGTSRDITGDGVPDVIVFYSAPLRAKVLSGVDLNEAKAVENPVDFGENYIRDEWMLGRFDDMNGDGTDEFVVTAEHAEVPIVAFLSGKDFTEIRRINIEWDKVRATRRYGCAGDLNDDGIADIVKASNAGGGEEGRESYLAVYSGADGSRIWRVEGTSIPTGVRRFTVDAKTGERTDLPADAGFGHTAAVVPDIDGDSKPEIAVTLASVVKGKMNNGILIFSGATGRHIETLIHTRDNFRLFAGGSSSQIAVLESVNRKGAPGIAVTGKVSEKKYGIAVFELERVD
jgi:hypothetical protein